MILSASIFLIYIFIYSSISRDIQNIYLLTLKHYSVVYIFNIVKGCILIMNEENTKFIDDKIEHIESDIKKIQTKPGMYIAQIGSAGALHLCKELINNAIDECINKNSPADVIDIFLDEGENEITVSDNGRGIPFDNMLVVCTTLQSGSKFTREGSGANSAGENGVGLTACNSLSHKFEIVSYRYGEKSKVSFEEGELIGSQTTTKIKNKDKHGTTFIIQPSRFYMGDDCDIIADDLVAWIEKIVYLIPSNIKLNLSIKKKGKESLFNKKYTNKNGLYDLVKKLCVRPILDPITFIQSMKMKEKVHDRIIDRFIGLEVAFTYDSSSVEFQSESFCNFVNTIDQGTHVDAVKTGILQYLTKQTKDSLSERDSKKIDIIFNDAAQGLFLTVNLSTDLNPQFTGQTKSKLGSNEFFKPLREMTYRALTEYFNKNPKDLKKIVDRVKTNAKARIESTKVRNSVIRGETTNFEEHLMENFIPANNRGKDEYRELLIIEGKSARGSVETGRFDSDTQAVFSIRGVPLNAFGLNIDKVLQNTEFNNLIKILGCNCGPRFDMTKLRYNKIIIMADADSDGFNITSLLSAFFITHLPDVVKDGRLYKSVTPLYKIKSKYKEFVLNKKEFVEIFERQVRDNLTVMNPSTKKMYSDKELQEVLMINRNYLEELTRLANRIVINPIILEYILIHRKEKDFYKNFRKAFPELTIDDDNVLTGVYEGRYQILIMDSIFEKRINHLEEFINDENKNMYFNVFEKTKDESIDKGVMSLCQFLSMAQKFQPIIKTRFKGIGELEARDLRDNALDPRNRILIRLTVSDLERDLEKFNILHGDDSSERRLLMEHFRIERDDLDN